ncbi:MAG: hypothetical protein OQL17_06390 [Sedimenticola sp.]|nr:hypothetical protein [Sedimenticola sp.]
MNNPLYSDEQINAFVDDELAQNERLVLLKAAVDSESLSTRIMELQYLKERTREAFPLQSKPASGLLTPSVSWTRYMTAAAMGGLSLFAILASTGHLQKTPVAPQTAINTTRSSAEQQTQTRVVFHISSDRQEDASLLLDQVELVLQEHQRSGRPIRLEVVANNQGLRMLQQGQSTVASRIRQLDAAYPGLVFAACGNTLERMTKETGEKITILPEAIIIRSGVSYITRRQQLGWSYIKV